jgi:hypothetical protein
VLKHGIDAEDAIQAATWATWIEDLDDNSPARQLRLGFDSGNELAIHAVKARPQMLDLLS